MGRFRSRDEVMTQKFFCYKNNRISNSGVIMEANTAYEAASRYVEFYHFSNTVVHMNNMIGRKEKEFLLEKIHVINKTTGNECTVEVRLKLYSALDTTIVYNKDSFVGNLIRKVKSSLFANRVFK